MVWHWNHPASNHCHRTNYWNGIVDQVLVIKLASTFDLRDGLPKKIAVLLDFVQMRGVVEGLAQIFCPLFTNCIYWVNLGMRREGETLAQIFWNICDAA